jgi:hypothetical protein
MSRYTARPASGNTSCGELGSEHAATSAKLGGAIPSNAPPTWVRAGRLFVDGGD